MFKRALLAVALMTAGITYLAGAATSQAATVHRVLFDNTKAETAGNADWIISTSQPDPLGQNANPTSETSWTGALSSWGVALQRTGEYSLKTLPAGNTITYGGSGALDLSKFDEFVMPEPNAPLSSAEKTAIMRFIQNGGGFFLIVDHTGSDRNSDGWDSVKVANDLLTNNGVDNTDPFGFSVDVNNIDTENPAAISSSTDPVINGPFGKVRGSIIRNGSTQTLHPSNNSSVKGLVYRSGFTPGGTTGAFFTTSTFGSGRVAVWGDSSPIDDGTGQSGNTLYDGWNDTAGTNAALALNATAWLAGTGTTTPPTTTPPTTPPGGGTCPGGQLFGNPGFETGSAGPWTATSGVVSSSSSEPAHSGSWKAWLDGYGAAHTDTLSQTVTIPSGCTRATLSFWLLVDTDETGSTAYDTLTVTAGSTTLATYSNVNASTSYQQKTLTVTGTGSVKVTFTGVEGTKIATSFVLDDLSLVPSA
ncbi:hydrolase [Dactylosporangium sp. CA-092794]|uniref:hydrolase n=1 Tax=Dactylosporangium sp. CA-092794 TaxID=3239929 RepID=UPI003D8A5D15